MDIYTIGNGGSDLKRLRAASDVPLDYFNGNRKLSGWQPIKVWCPHPERAGFYDISQLGPLGALVLTAAAKDLLISILASSNVELLPLMFERRQFYILNPLEIDDCSEAIRGVKWGEPGSLQFFPERIGAILFKRQQMSRGTIYTLEKTGDPATEFKAAVEHHKLQGLRFKRIWSDQTPRERMVERIKNRPPAPEGIHDLEEIFDYAAWRGEEQAGPLVRQLLTTTSPGDTFLACNALMAWLKTHACIRAKVKALLAKPFNYHLHPFAPAVLQLIENSSELQQLFHVTEVEGGFEVDFRPEIEQARRMEIEEYARHRSEEHRK